jgi:hypothetical protein
MIEGEIAHSAASGAKVIILEWYALHRLGLWDNSDLRVLMQADTAERHSRLAARHGNKFEASFYVIRDEQLKADYTNLSVAPDFTFANHDLKEVRGYATQIAARVNHDLEALNQIAIKPTQGIVQH